MKALAVAFGLGGVLLSACVPAAPHFLTPQGQELTTTRCEVSKPGKPGGLNIFQARDITNTPSNIETCKNQGGEFRQTLQMDSTVTYFCNYREPPAADAGKSCTRASDCSVGCDAVERVCRASWGLGDTLGADGEVVTAVE
jgi:hypothetical protein